MSYEMERCFFENFFNKSLSLTECGFQKSHSGHTPGKRIYTDYSAHFIISGKGTFSTNGKTYSLERGQGFMIIPGVPNIYTADENDPWQYIYASFKGVDRETIIHSAGIDENNVIFSFPTDDAMLDNLNKMYRAGRNRLTKGYEALGYFFLAMSRLIEEHSKTIKPSFSEEYYIKMAVSYIDEHYTRAITVKNVADYLGFDRTYFYRMFIKKKGISPSKYISDVRLKKAVALMSMQSLSLNEIAVSTGFYDFSHFTKSFITKYGISPGEYRKQYIENEV